MTFWCPLLIKLPVKVFFPTDLIKFGNELAV